MRLPLAIVVVVTLVSLAGCGSAPASDDQFVGTWRVVGDQDASGSLVLARVPDGYQAFLVLDPGPVVGPIPLQRQGDELVFAAQGDVERQTFTFDSDSGRLTVVDGSNPGVDFERVSSSTSHPMPQSQNPSPDTTF
jgi:hypothetical protein